MCLLAFGFPRAQRTPIECPLDCSKNLKFNKSVEFECRTCKRTPEEEEKRDKRGAKEGPCF